MTTTAVDDQFAPEPIQELEQKHHDKIVGIIAEKIEAERRPAPHGWKLVPVEMTLEMIQAAMDAETVSEMWGEVLAVAPTPPAQAEPSDEELFSQWEEAYFAESETTLRQGIIRFARALLARYGRQQAESSETAATVNRETVIEWLDALDIEVTDKQLDGLFHAAPVAAQAPAESADQVQALREALDALKAENEMLREALKDADSEMDWLDEDMDTCDHSVGVCMCSYWSVRRKMKAALAQEGGQ